MGRGGGVSRVDREPTAVATTMSSVYLYECSLSNSVKSDKLSGLFFAVSQNTTVVEVKETRNREPRLWMSLFFAVLKCGKKKKKKRNHPCTPK